MHMRSKCTAVLLLLTNLIGCRAQAQTPWKPVNLQDLICGTGPTVTKVKFESNEFATSGRSKPNVISFMRSERTPVTVEYKVVQTNGGVPVIPTKTVQLPQLAARRLGKANSSDIIDEFDDEEREPETYSLPDGSTFQATPELDEDTPGIDTLVETSDQTSDLAAPRKLAARRRGGGSFRSSGGSYSSRRRGGSSWSRPAPRPTPPYQVRRRGAPAGAPPVPAAPARPPQGYQGPASYSSGGVNYGYSSKPSYYGSNTPTYNSNYGSYSGKTSSGYSTGAVVAGVAGGAIAGAGAYYMYSQYRSSFSCSGWDCCYGCSRSCFNSGSNPQCRPQRTGNSFQDDMMKEAMIPFNKAPVTIEFSSFSSTDPKYQRAAICPPSGWTTSSNYTFPPSGTFWVTWTAMSEFAGVGAATRNWGTPSFTAIFIVAVNLRSLMRRVFV